MRTRAVHAVTAVQTMISNGGLPPPTRRAAGYYANRESEKQDAVESGMSSEEDGDMPQDDDAAAHTTTVDEQAAEARPNALREPTPLGRDRTLMSAPALLERSSAEISGEASRPQEGGSSGVT